MPRAERRPWSPFYWADWLADEGVQSMTFDEQGRYLRVLAFSNQSATPGVATEDQIRRWAAYGTPDWPEHREAFARCFSIRGERWTQKRTELEARRAEQFQRMQSARGQKGAAVTNAIRKSSTQAPPLERRPEVGLSQSQSQEDSVPVSVSVAVDVCKCKDVLREPERCENAESGNGVARAKHSPAIAELPVKAGKQPYLVTTVAADEWRRLYPGLDVEAEIRKATAWLLANPTRRKTRTGIPRFLNSWLARAHDSVRLPTTDPAPQPDESMARMRKLLAEKEAKIASR